MALASRIGVLTLALVVSGPRAQAAIEAPPTVHPLYVSADGAAHDREATETLRAIVKRRRMGLLEVMDLPGPTGDSNMRLAKKML
jgi:hypothetical protein